MNNIIVSHPRSPQVYGIAVFFYFDFFFLLDSILIDVQNSFTFCGLFTYMQLYQPRDCVNLNVF